MKRILLTGALIVSILIGANAAVAPRQVPRVSTFELAEARAVNYVGAPLELLILGDSRSRKLRAGRLATKLGLDANAAVNASTISGDFTTADGLARAWSPHVADDVVVLLGVSEYWTEVDDADERLGVLPDPAIYLAAGQYSLALSAALPLSRSRGKIVEVLRRELEGTAAVVSTALGWKVPPDAPMNEEPGELGKSNVDMWFRPVTDEQIAECRALGELRLARMIEAMPESAQFVVIFMPNAEQRMRYVEKTYPGRSARGRSSLSQISAARGVPFVNLWNSLTADRWFIDYHHLNLNGTFEFELILAAAVMPELDGKVSPSRTCYDAVTLETESGSFATGNRTQVTPAHRDRPH